MYSFMIWLKSLLRISAAFWPRGQAVKTSPFHGGNTGSIPVGVISVIAYADVAQLAEQLICNQQVIGSSPIIGFVPEGTLINLDL